MTVFDSLEHRTTIHAFGDRKPHRVEQGRRDVRYVRFIGPERARLRADVKRRVVLRVHPGENFPIHQLFFVHRAFEIVSVNRLDAEVGREVDAGAR